MKEFIEKLIGKIENEAFAVQLEKGIKHPSTLDAMMEKFSVFRIKEIVNKLAEEHKGGWIPCSEDKPNKNGWYECWYMTSAVGENKYYEPITLYWEDNIWLYRPNKFTMPTQSNVVAWKPITPYQPKGE